MRFRLPVSLMLGIMVGSISVLNVPDLMSVAEGTQSAALEPQAIQSFIQRDHNLVLEQSGFYQQNRDLIDNFEVLQQRSELFYLYQDKINDLFEENMQLF